MNVRDPRVDAYIERSAEFARPILQSLRETIHATCPGVEETLKWSIPHFMHGGAILCAMAAFKQHATFGFWKAPLLDDPALADRGESAMGQFGRLTALADLPPRRQLQKLLRQAMQLNATRAKVPSRARKPARQDIELPDDLVRALAANTRARSTFDGFPPGQQREYVDWITGAKQEPTRRRRLERAIEWLADGKRRNWKYESTRNA